MKGQCLQVDAGNTQIKWRLTEEGVAVARGASATADVAAGEALALPSGRQFVQVAICSVAEDLVTRRLIDQLQPMSDEPVQVAKVARESVGVTCGYDQLSKLGVDRWMAVVAAAKHFPGDLVVVDAGSAITIDIVDTGGAHRGGYIVPGLNLMRNALWSGTDRVKAEADWSGPVGEAATDTEPAVNRGCLYMAVSTIERMVEDFNGRLILTGGDADLLHSYLHCDADLVPDLVMDGLLLYVDQGGGEG